MTEKAAERECWFCRGCGQVANTEDQEPWSAWEKLAPREDSAVKLRIVQPMPCPRCHGKGTIG